MKPSVLFLTALPLGIALTGCGGGGDGIVTPTSIPTTQPTTGPTSTPVLTGNTAVRAIVTSGYQGYRSQVNYAFRGLQIALPPSSPFKAQMQKASLANKRAVSATLSYEPELGLYYSTTTSGNVTTLRAFTDAAGKQSAGTATLTAPAGQMVGDDYSSYPVAIQLSVNITAGNIPCQGSGTLTFSGASGKNTLTGQLTLPKTGLTVRANLTLSDSGQLGGNLTIVGNGQTISLTNLSGSLSGDITANVAVAPDGATGTAIINLASGKFQVTLTTKSGTATATASPTTGALAVTYPDGTKENLTSPLLVVGGTAPGATPTPVPTMTPTARPTSTPSPTPTTPVTVAYNAPVNLNTVTFYTGSPTRYVNNTGAFVTSDANGNPIYFVSPSSSPQLLNGGDASPQIINNSGMITGVYGGNSLFWSSPSATAQYLHSASGNFGNFPKDLNDKGELVGYSLDDHTALYWSSGTADATVLPAFASGAQTTAYGINNSGLIIGTSSTSKTDPSTGFPVATITPIYWTNHLAKPKALNIGTLSSVLRSGGFNTYGVNSSGQIYATGVGGTAFWSSVSATPIVLPALPNGNSPTATGISDDGTVVGYCNVFSSSTTSNTEHAVRWRNGQVQDLNSLIPSGSGLMLQEAVSVSANGIIVGNATQNGKSVGFYLKPKIG